MERKNQKQKRERISPQKQATSDRKSLQFDELIERKWKELRSTYKRRYTEASRRDPDMEESGFEKVLNRLGNHHFRRGNRSRGWDADTDFRHS